MPEQGRPTKYKPEYDRIAAQFAKLGATDEQLAELFEVNEDTIYEWKKVHPSFSDSINKSKEFPDSEIEASLFKRAKGYTRWVEKTTKKGVVKCEEELPPDPTSMIFWLKNRKPKQWRDVQQQEHSGEISLIGIKLKK